MNFGKLFREKKGQVINGLSSNITAFVVMIFVVGALVYALSTFSGGLTAGSDAKNITDELLLTIKDNVTLIGVVFIMIVVAVVIFIARRMNQG